jgi:Co/Zn/Cd efflux system component
LSDAAHLFSDLASFAVAIGASYLASLPATAQHTYGLKRSESLAALFSMVSLAFVSAGLSYEAVRRYVNALVMTDGGSVGTRWKKLPAGPSGGSFAISRHP